MSSRNQTENADFLTFLEQDLVGNNIPCLQNIISEIKSADCLPLSTYRLLQKDDWEKRCPGYGDFIYNFLHPSQGILLFNLKESSIKRRKLHADFDADPKILLGELNWPRLQSLPPVNELKVFLKKKLPFSLTCTGLPENLCDGLVNGTGSVYSHFLSSNLISIYGLSDMNTVSVISEISIASYYDNYLKTLLEVSNI